MSQTKTRRVSSWVGWIVSAVLIIGSVWLWLERQYVVDAIQYYQYTPTPAIEAVSDEVDFTDSAKFTFYATRPSIESSKNFNQHCKRKEASSPILGCYNGDRTFIFDVADDRLEGIEAVTAAHEFLHAAYDRLSDSEKKRLEPLLKASYKKGVDKNLDSRIGYYERTQPGGLIDELHSIIGTESTSISSELETYYKKYFKNRNAIVARHQQVEAAFNKLSKEADELVEKIEALTQSINQATEQYNAQIEELNQEIAAFNATAAQPGGFTTQQEFQAARQALIARSNALSEARQDIQAKIAQHKVLIAQLDAINTEAAKLNKSLDSTLVDAPKL